MDLYNYIDEVKVLEIYSKIKSGDINRKKINNRLWWHRSKGNLRLVIAHLIAWEIYEGELNE